MKFVCKLVLAMTVIVAVLAGCNESPTRQVVVYCAVDEPYAGKVFAEFERQTGIHVRPVYDVESSKSVGLAGRLEAEKAHPDADVWWGSEAFLTARLAGEGILAPYASPAAADVLPEYKDHENYWTGVGLRARVIAIGPSAPPFPVTSIHDLIDPRLRGKIAIARPTAGATGAHCTVLYLLWGDEKASAFFRALHDNGVTLVGGNAVVAEQVAAGSFQVGLTDSDDVLNTANNGGKITMIIPDQGPGQEGTVTMPTTVAMVAGATHPDAAKRLIDFLVSRQTEDRLKELGFVKWSTRKSPDGGSIKSIPVDFRKAAQIYAASARKATELLEGRNGS